MGTKNKDEKHADDAVQAVRRAIASATQCANADPVDNDRCSAKIRAHLLQAWQNKALDPDHAAPQCLIDGAGIREHTDDCGIFQAIDE